MIPINRPDISEADLKAYIDLKPATLNDGKAVRELESVFAERYGREYHAVFTGSAKTALFFLFKALDYSNGEVVTSPLTCFAALSPVVAAGLTPRYGDVDPDRFLIDEGNVQRLIAKPTRAVLSIALGGCAGRMEELQKYTRDAGITLIEDCAQGLGSRYQGELLGAFGDYAFFSFTKHLSLVGGGMLLSKNRDVIQRVRDLQATLPYTPDGLLAYRFERDCLEAQLGTTEANALYRDRFLAKGENYSESNPKDAFVGAGVMHRPTDFQALMVLRQMMNIDDLVARRRACAEDIKTGLSGLPGVHFQVDEGASSYAKLYLRTEKPTADLIPALMKAGVDAKQLTKSHGLYLQKRIDQTTFLFHESVRQCSHYLNLHDCLVELPLSSSMSPTEVATIICETRNCVA